MGRDDDMSGEYGKLKRHDFKLLLESLYGLEVKNMQESGKGILVHTDNGIKRLKETKSDEAKILFAASAYEHIYNNGFRNISCINRNLGGSYHMRYERSNYILQDFIEGKVFEIKSREAAALAGRTLAEFHKAGEQFVPAPGSRARVDWGKWMEKLRSNSVSLNKYKEIICLKGKNNEFDKVFCANVNDFLRDMQCSHELLQGGGYLERVRDSMACNQITHSSFKKHAILEADGTVFITNLEECSYDICEFDTATLLESFSGKNSLELVKAALEGYSAVKPISSGSIRIIAAFLMFPRRFYKIAESAYGKKKNYNEKELTLKLERSIRREKRKQRIAEYLISL